MKKFGSKQGVIFWGFRSQYKIQVKRKVNSPGGITCPEFGKKNSSSLCFLILVLMIPATINFS